MALVLNADIPEKSTVISLCTAAYKDEGSPSRTLRGPSNETCMLVLIHVSIINTEETTQSTERLLVTTGTL